MGAAHLDEQDGEIAAGTGAEGQRLGRGLDAALLAPGIGDGVVDHRVQGGHERDGLLGGIDHVLREPAAEARLGLVKGRDEIGCERKLVGRTVGEGKLGRGRPEQEVERVAVEGLDFELGADVEGGGPVPEMRPEGGVVLGVERGEHAGPGGKRAAEVPEAVQQGLPNETSWA